jgi:competence ComEA-like helix-hairpin-helix protein
MGTPGGRINLPIGMILRCLPPEVLTDELSKFEATGAAAVEIGLPMNMILGQLPSGKVEMAFQDLIPHFPAGYLQPTESIASYLPNLISLPLMDVVMRIPPDLLALRPDQKDVDASVINMADPFTEEILREQAEAARRQSQTNIIEESQAPHEEFVPRDQAETAKSAVPPPSPPAEPLIASSTPAATTPSAAKPPAPPPMGGLRGSPAVPPPAESPAPVPPVPRHTGAIPAPPPPRHTTSLPVPRRTGSIPAPSQATSPSTVGAVAAQAPAPAEKPAAAAVAGASDSGADNLQRLAALAMSQLGDSTESATEVPPKSEPVASPPTEPKIKGFNIEEFKIAEPKTEAPAPAIASTPAPASQPPPVAPSEPPVKAILEPLPSASVAHLPAEPKVHTAAPSASVAFNLNMCTAEDLIHNIPGCSQGLAESIVQYRSKIGSFKRLEDLLDVPGITKAAYTHLTGEAPPDNRIPLSLNELLGFPADQHIALKDVTDRIACWPDVTGCVLSQSSGLSLVGTVAEGFDKEALVAFAPRMFEAVNKSFSEVSGQETDALVIPSSGTSFHLFRNRDLYLIIMSRLPQMPERHLKVARFVLAALSIRRD